MDKLNCINYFLERNILLSPDFFEKEVDIENFYDMVKIQKLLVHQA